ncbi:MAG: hypothetical protein HY544_00655 [Candidatus Diapherotrites archaeon]|uniref:Uncharacterized protein n=1 Tax=Candidatus Iainarchaeum sp. TaxID=3101447 RepID=A0A8T3YIB7_9ARCH|nr:hypothetical protein [Candidatus Diapherotrites archaeon]
MEKDKIIAATLVAALIFLVVAFIGLVAITGFVFLASGNSDTNSDDTPAINSVVVDANKLKDSNSVSGADSNANADANSQKEPAAPVCGNKVKETGEACEADSECSASQLCKSCKCEDKPPEIKAAPDISIVESSMLYQCITKGGKKGLGIKYIEFKNSGSSDYEVNGILTVSSSVGSVSDKITSNATKSFTIKAGQAYTDFYISKIPGVEPPPFLFLGNGPSKPTIKIDFGNKQYVEKTYTLSTAEFEKGGGVSGSCP